MASRLFVSQTYISVIRTSCDLINQQRERERVLCGIAERRRNKHWYMLYSKSLFYLVPEILALYNIDKWCRTWNKSKWLCLTMHVQIMAWGSFGFLLRFICSIIFCLVFSTREGRRFLSISNIQNAALTIYMSEMTV